MPRLDDIKEAIGRALGVDPRNLFAMPIDDVELSAEAQDALFDELATAVRSPDNPAPPSRLACEIGLPCTGFWLEGTGELVVHVWSAAFAKTIVVPAPRWRVRPDRTRH